MRSDNAGGGQWDGGGDVGVLALWGRHGRLLAGGSVRAGFLAGSVPGEPCPARPAVCGGCALAQSRLQAGEWLNGW